MYYPGIIDTHAHYDDRRFAENLGRVLEDQRAHGVERIISCGSSLETSRRNAEIANRFDFVFATAGVHPSDADGMPDDWIDQIERMTKDPKVVAVGEIGLDYHYKTPSREIQRRAFVRQLELARDIDMPVQIHDREAHQEIFDLVKHYRPRGCLHRCSVSVEMAREYVKLGLYLGIGGALTYKNMKKEREVVADIPLEWLILETDCPYLTPEPFRGQTCTSDMLWTVVDLIGEMKGIEPERVVEVTNQNAKRAFGLAV